MNLVVLNHQRHQVCLVKASRKPLRFLSNTSWMLPKGHRSKVKVVSRLRCCSWPKCIGLTRQSVRDMAWPSIGTISPWRQLVNKMLKHWKNKLSWPDKNKVKLQNLVCENKGHKQRHKQHTHTPTPTDTHPEWVSDVAHGTHVQELGFRDCLWLTCFPGRGSDDMEHLGMQQPERLWTSLYSQWLLG